METPLISEQVKGNPSLCTCHAAPSGPPTSVHLVVLNQSAVEVQWNLPLDNLRNGEIRGFKIFYRERAGNASETMIDVANGDALEYVVGGLKPGTVYTFSILAYTGSDGPRSIHLSVATFSEGTVAPVQVGLCFLRSLWRGEGLANLARSSNLAFSIPGAEGLN